MYKKQKGKNNNYPNLIETWRAGEPIPEWLSDRCKVNYVDENGNITIGTSEMSNGGFEIKNAQGDGVLVCVPEQFGYVCFGDNHIFSLSQVQMNLLYIDI